MAALEFRVLSKILKEKSLTEALRAGLREDTFKDPEARQIYAYLRNHWYNRNTTKTLPSVAAVQRKWPSFQLTADPYEDSHLRAMIEELRQATLETDTRSLASYFMELSDSDPEGALEFIMNKAAEIVSRRQGSEHLGMKDVLEVASEHYSGAKSGAIFGIPWAWECLTEDTLGKNPGDFIVFYGRMKSMKTWTMLFNAAFDFLENNARVIVWSREMNKTKLCLRLASLIAGVDYQLFKKGKLPKKVAKRAFDTLQVLMEQEDEFQLRERDAEGNPIGELSEDARLGRRNLKILAGRNAPKTVGELRSIIQDYKPDVVYLDSFYHLESERTDSPVRHVRIATLAEDIKALAEDEEIPIIAVHQANRSGEKTYGNTMSDMAESDVIAREADLIIRVLMRRGHELYEEDYEVEKEKEKAAAQAKREAKGSVRRGRRRMLPRKVEPKEEEELPGKVEAVDSEKDDTEPVRVGAELALVMGGNREGVLEAFTIHAIPGYNFNVISTNHTTAEIREWVGRDEADDGPASKKPAAAVKRPPKPNFSPSTFKNFKASK